MLRTRLGHFKVSVFPMGQPLWLRSWEDFSTVNKLTDHTLFPSWRVCGALVQCYQNRTHLPASRLSASHI